MLQQALPAEPQEPPADWAPLEPQALPPQQVAEAAVPREPGARVEALTVQAAVAVEPLQPARGEERRRAVKAAARSR